MTRNRGEEPQGEQKIGNCICPNIKQLPLSLGMFIGRAQAGTKTHIEDYTKNNAITCLIGDYLVGSDVSLTCDWEMT
jgi:hypothetical protein